MLRSLKVCSVPSCPELTLSGKCSAHAAAARAAQDAVRGNWRERGYDAEYDRNRVIVLREEDTCWLCSVTVDKTLPGTHRDGPSVDHVIRREDGGSNARDNLRLTHLRCNTGRRSAAPSSPPPRPAPPVYRTRSAGLR